MKTLALIRHAKSDWGAAGTPDHDRTLAPRGRHDAPVMAERLRERVAATPLQRIVASTAVRARTTAEYFAAATGAPLALDRRLYGAAPRELRHVASEQDVDSLALVAHEPGLSHWAHELSSTARGRAITEMPTCAVALFVWPDADDWAVVEAIAPDVWFASPRA